MPTKTVTHEKWCHEHTPAEEGPGVEVCSSRMLDFGAMLPHWEEGEDPYPRGSMYFSQGEDETEPRIYIEYAGSGVIGHEEIPLHTLRQLARALNEAPDSTIKSILSIADELSA